MWTLLIAAGLVPMGACETVVDVDLPAQASELVINSFFSPDSVWAIEIGRTLPFNASNAPAVENPIIELIGEGGSVNGFVADETFFSASTAKKRYVAPSKPSPGMEYSIRIAVDGFEPVVARNQAPEAPAVDDIQVTPVYFEQNPGVLERVDVTLTLIDPAGRSDYYGLYVMRTIEPFDIETGISGGKSVFRTGFTTRDPSLVDEEFFDVEETFVGESFFTDDLFEGRSHALKFSVHDVGFFDSSQQRIDQSLAIHLLSVSEDMYRYRKSARQQQTVADDPFSEPVQVHSNLSNGFGIFAGYQARVFTIDLDSPDVVNE